MVSDLNYPYFMQYGKWKKLFTENKIQYLTSQQTPESFKLKTIILSKY